MLFRRVPVRRCGDEDHPRYRYSLFDAQGALELRQVELLERQDLPSPRGSA
jgi:hypothetical protein